MKKLTYEVIIVDDKACDIITTTVKGTTAAQARSIAESLYKKPHTRVTLGACLDE